MHMFIPYTYMAVKGISPNNFDTNLWKPLDTPKKIWFEAEMEGKQTLS